MSIFTLADIIGSAAAVLTTAAAVPQVLFLKLKHGA
jgi:hypothetical protein